MNLARDCLQWRRPARSSPSRRAPPRVLPFDGEGCRSSPPHEAPLPPSVHSSRVHSMQTRQPAETAQPVQRPAPRLAQREQLPAPAQRGPRREPHASPSRRLGRSATPRLRDARIAMKTTTAATAASAGTATRHLRYHGTSDAAFAPRALSSARAISASNTWHRMQSAKCASRRSRSAADNDLSLYAASDSAFAQSGVAASGCSRIARRRIASSGSLFRSAFFTVSCYPRFLTL